MLSKLNPNVEIPVPKIIELKKIAIKLPQYDQLRYQGTPIQDIPEPAP